MLNVGIWIPLPRGTHWQGEGIARTIEFIVKGMIDEGLVGKDIRLVVYTTHWTEDSMQRSFKDLLGDDYDKIEFRFLTSSTLNKWQLGIATAIADIMFAKPVLFDKKRDFFDSIDPNNPKSKKLSYSKLKEYYSGGASVNYGRPVVWPFAVRPAESDFFLSKMLYERRLKKFCKKYKTTPEELETNRKEIMSSDNKDREMRMSFRLKNRERLLNFVHDFAAKTRLGRRLYNRLVNVAEEKSFMQHIVECSQADFPDVDVWWTPSPVVRGVELLQKPNLVNFYDFFVGEFGYYWPSNQVSEIYYRLALILSRAKSVITQSRFNKYEKIVHPFEVTPEQITVCNFAAPGHYRKYVPSYDETGVKTQETLKEAGDLIRNEMVLRATATNRESDYARIGGQNDLLTQFDFENEKYVLISTQNRPYKNLKFIIEIIPQIIEQMGENVYFFFTAELDYTKFEDDPLIKFIFKKRLQRFIFSVPRLPDKVHAAMYHCATMSLHPSLAEGGVGSYPFMEGMTMGTPGLTGAGDHTHEGSNLHPDYESVTYRTNDKENAVERIVAILNSPNDAYEKQLPVFEKHRDWSWPRVGKVYRDALWATSGRTDYTPLMLAASEKISPYFEPPGTHPQPGESKPATDKKKVAEQIAI